LTVAVSLYIHIAMLADELDDRAFKALGHRDRRAILRLLAEGEQPVGEVVEAVGLDQPIVSQHLKVLRTAGLVSARTEANRRVYRVDFARFSEIRRFLDVFWSDRLLALKDIAESRSP
jgi:DNA-binding transcriptional ArsR family regulator